MTNLYFVIAIIANLICIIRGKLVCKEADVVKDFQKDAVSTIINFKIV